MSRRILRNRRDPELKVYDEDFDLVATRFRPTVTSADWIALPGAVMDTVVPCSDEYPQLSLEASHLKGYKMDTGDVLWTEKQQIASLVAAFDSKLINTDEFTLAPGVSSALLIIMAALKSMGIGEIIFELPAYFAGIEQAELLGLNVGLFPASPSSGYRITPQDIIDIDRISSAPVALMITQPRYGLGYNRKTEELLKLREALRPGDIIVVDEAADQSAPSPFGKVELDGDVKIIRVRGLTKGLGLNSAKIATILHPTDMRPLLGEIVDFTGGAIDAAAMRLVLELAKKPMRYLALLEGARNYVRQQYQTLQSMIMGLPITLAPIENSYLATAHFRSPPNVDFDQFREYFLYTAVEIKLPIVRGSSLYFPYDASGEIIRINYFTPPENMTRSGTAFQKFSTSLYERL
ncbi:MULTISPECIES: aminotransferase class I/II-fold pyridoxal phosphate-dependent enzyme [Thalassospira]|jgi:histidinol-phosphate/aromatic aminotransferase/cobyric acid decarboxylase-like protein|uniref:Aminotransferase class I/classII large domain-containing protein n=3 Tax=Thalassospira xiamenensis TaxID=220697 RepID=A0ABR5XX39_9PROT|nr:MULTISPECIES: aminotransferase class I/II-fold pyridoxal phosphate-dependent enzyme [Thalassospira]KZC97673.1 hypothetical protein AUP40_22300 [Thalassospira xiamenensis]KZD06789.1 hypothetical protein AUP45_19530 [Thalassospira xiamenensis]MAB32970.1 hypothetical protein [Thalassospira sp.]MAL29757.1 hypothetical protein [Thalassospira sp.]MBA06933.1 hypothetical protein [Thalassospira sp.]|tara:strand:+ start:458 stop:1678 length:1221 start_codon:yes stop_codon:yes gene_type:complete